MIGIPATEDAAISSGHATWCILLKVASPTWTVLVLFEEVRIRGIYRSFQLATKVFIANTARAGVERGMMIS